jgi:nucleoside-diphosphate-sugar epimerase
VNVFIIGGTGLLGCAAAQEFINRGHHVKSIALPPLPEGAPIPPEMDLTFGNYNTMTDAELSDILQGCDCFVFAAGVDERIAFRKPVYDSYIQYNVEPLHRLLPLAKAAGAKRIVVLGSYFSYFAKTFPKMQLAEKHPYIRSRLEQEEVALSYADSGTSVTVLELPYIFGIQPGRQPVWTILIEQLRNMPRHFTLYPKGGTAMVTVRQTAQAIAGAAEPEAPAGAIPISMFNLSWDAFLRIVHEAMGEANRHILHVYRWMFRIFGRGQRKKNSADGVEAGIDPVGLADIMHMKAYIDTKFAETLGVTWDDIRAAITDSIRLSMEAVLQKKPLVGMKAG